MAIDRATGSRAPAVGSFYRCCGRRRLHSHGSLSGCNYHGRARAVCRARDRSGGRGFVFHFICCFRPSRTRTAANPRLQYVRRRGHFDSMVVQSCFHTGDFGGRSAYLIFFGEREKIARLASAQ